MGYQLGVNINAMKASDFSNLEGVSLQVYLEGENFSIMTLTTDNTGHVYENLDRSHYQETDIGRVQVYYSKPGYGPGCAMLVKDRDFLDGNSVKHYIVDVDLLLVASDTEILPPPTIESVALVAKDGNMAPLADVACDICLMTSDVPLASCLTGSNGTVTVDLTSLQGQPSQLKIKYSKAGYQPGSAFALLDISDQCYKCQMYLLP